MGWRIIYVSPPGKACLVSRWGLSQFPVKPASNPGRFVSRFPVGGCFESRWKSVSDPGAFKNVIAGSSWNPGLRKQVRKHAGKPASQHAGRNAGRLAKKQTKQHASLQESQPADRPSNLPSCGLTGRHAIQEAG